MLRCPPRLQHTQMPPLSVYVAALLISCALLTSSASIFSCDAGAHRLEVENSTALGYAVTVAGQAWLSGGALRVHVADTWFSTDSIPGGIVLQDVRASSGIDPRLGPYTALDASWRIPAAAGLAVQSSFRCFDASGGAIIFTLEFPKGAEGVALAPFPPAEPLPHYNSSVTPVTLFPVFLSGPWTLLGSELGFLEWLGNWAATENHVGHGLAAAPDPFAGGQASGPLVLFNASMPEGGPALVLAPAGHYKTAIIGQVNSSSAGGGCPGPSAVGVGPHGYIPALPPGFSLDVLLASSPLGIGDAVARWGAASQVWANTSRLAPEADVVSSRLSYFTDNVSFFGDDVQTVLVGNSPVASPAAQGAFYSDYYWPLHPETTADAVLVALSAYHRASGIPVRTYQLDPYWYPRDSAGAMTDWAPVSSLFPNGLAHLASPPYNLSFMFYSAYFSLNKSAQLLSNYTWVASQVFSVLQELGSWFGPCLCPCALSRVPCVRRCQTRRRSSAASQSMKRHLSTRSLLHAARNGALSDSKPTGL